MSEKFHQINLQRLVFLNIFHEFIKFMLIYVNKIRLIIFSEDNF